jgi:hypothetical protein
VPARQDDAAFGMRRVPRLVHGRTPFVNLVENWENLTTAEARDLAALKNKGPNDRSDTSLARDTGKGTSTRQKRP